MTKTNVDFEQKVSTRGMQIFSTIDSYLIQIFYPSSTRELPSKQKLCVLRSSGICAENMPRFYQTEA